MDVNCILEHLTLTQEIITLSRPYNRHNIEVLGQAPSAQRTDAFIFFPPLFGLCLKTRFYNDSLTNMHINHIRQVSSRDRRVAARETGVIKEAYLYTAQTPNLRPL